jgi:hypothetical protein
MGNVKNTIELRICKSIALVEGVHQGVPRGSIRRAGVLSLHWVRLDTLVGDEDSTHIRSTWSNTGRERTFV